MIHGDAHIGNLFDDRGRTGFLDWGIVNVGPAERELGYLLCMALSVEDRRAWERELIAHYLDVRKALGAQPIAFDAAWHAHRSNASYLVPACCQIVTFPEGISEPRRIFSEAFLARAAAAVDDLEGVALLQEELG